MAELKESMLKNLIIKCLEFAGYELRRKPPFDLSLYDNFPASSKSEKRFYNIGAGSFFHPYWTNIDYTTEYYSSVQRRPFINYDLMAMKPLPIEDNIAEILYSSHTIEHVSDEAVLNMFHESFRILKPGGYIRVTTPDAELEFAAYSRNDIKYWYWIEWYSQPGSWEKLYRVPLSKASIHQLFLHHFASQLTQIDISELPEKKFSDSEIAEIFSTPCMEDALNYFTKKCKFDPGAPGNHINWWSTKKVISFLHEAGFQKCYTSGYGQSGSPPSAIPICSTTRIQRYRYM